jgi:phenylalanine ammonia-lyase
VESAEMMFNLLNESQLAQTQEEELHIGEDKGLLRQDRYPLRTAPQFIGPALEDILASLDTVTMECNSSK